MTVTSMLRQAASRNDYEYAGTFATLRGWTFVSFTNKSFTARENAAAAKSAIRILLQAQQRGGGTHFTFDGGLVRSTSAPIQSVAS